MVKSTFLRSFFHWTQHSGLLLRDAPLAARGGCIHDHSLTTGHIHGGADGTDAGTSGNSGCIHDEDACLDGTDAGTLSSSGCIHVEDFCSKLSV